MRMRTSRTLAQIAVENRARADVRPFGLSYDIPS
jgi:hypothetical protein